MPAFMDTLNHVIDSIHWLLAEYFLYSYLAYLILRREISIDSYHKRSAMGSLGARAQSEACAANEGLSTEVYPSFPLPF